ncbi:protein of unknown function [Candidatus Nitrosotalea okcheonensis]|uniref:Uncharacterized protein n=1 Tax=Candidatus Nitrosotalea okcheonensis TaxID=1903276 RepID=A0A2H1FHH3_9ARCH|nr:protein of unknown function [Candidatus Nitrosotalea okcheonensis]
MFIYPSFIQAAYEEGDFYDYYRKNCDSSCLTVPIPTSVNGSSLQALLAHGFSN